MHFRGLRVAIVGSAPSVLKNSPGYVDSFDVVCRVNNYKTGLNQGVRCDVFYSFFGTSIRKTPGELAKDGVRLCMAKCPDAKALSCEWHEQRRKLTGIDFRYIYRRRAGWWWCDTYIPTTERFLRSVEILGGHIPTTGFSAILDVLACDPAEVHVTGFDFFTSRVHNVNERWIPGDPADPIGHRPELERRWLKRNQGAFPISFDPTMEALIRR